MAPSADNSKLFARASLLLIGLAWTLPFLQPYHRFPLPSFYAEWLALVLGLLALVPLLKRDSWDGLPVPLVSLAALLLIALIWLQFALGLIPYMGQALAPSICLLWAALLMLLGNLLRRELGLESVTASLAWFLLAGGVLSAAAGIAQHYQVTPLAGTVVTPTRALQVFGNLSQENHYAAYLALALVSLAYLASRRRLAPAVVVPIAAALVFAAAISGSRSFWLYVGAMLLVAVALFKREPGHESRRLLVICAVLLAAFAAMNGLAGLSWLAPAETEVNTSFDRLFARAAGASVRIALWQEAWWMFTGSPVLGIGFGQFAWHHFEYAVLFGPAEIGLTNNAHNIVLHLMAETGLPGAALVTGAAAHWLIALRGARMNADLWWLLAILSVIAVYSLLEHPLWYAFFLGIAAIALGIGTTRSVPINLRRIGVPLAALVLVTGLVHAALTLRDFRRMEQLVFTPYRTLAEIPEAAVFRDVLTELHQDPVLASYVDVVVALGITVTEEKLPEKIELVTRAMHFAPVPFLVYQRAMLLALAGERAAALAQLERALRVYPEDADKLALELTELARRHPREFGPLLELAAARSAALRAPAKTR